LVFPEKWLLFGVLLAIYFALVDGFVVPTVFVSYPFERQTFYLF
jgi:hypothetical protein